MYCALPREQSSNRKSAPVLPTDTTNRTDIISSFPFQCGTSYSYNVYGAGPGTTASTPIKPVNVVRSLNPTSDVEARSGWQAMLGSGQGKMHKRSKHAQ